MKHLMITLTPDSQTQVLDLISSFAVKQNERIKVTVITANEEDDTTRIEEAVKNMSIKSPMVLNIVKGGNDYGDILLKLIETVGEHEAVYVNTTYASKALCLLVSIVVNIVHELGVDVTIKNVILEEHGEDESSLLLLNAVFIGIVGLRHDHPMEILKRMIDL